VVRPSLAAPSFLVFVARLAAAVKPPVIACAPDRVAPTRRRAAKPEPRDTSGKFQRPCTTARTRDRAGTGIPAMPLRSSVSARHAELRHRRRASLLAQGHFFLCHNRNL
jgi:hypothetical protein